MSKWTELRDGVLEAMKQGTIQVTEKVKQEFMTNFVEAGVPVIEAYAEKFTEMVKAQAAEETGWCKVRDLIVIPFAVRLALYVGKQILAFVTSQTQTKDAASDA